MRDIGLSVSVEETCQQVSSQCWNSSSFSRCLVQHV